MRRLTLLTSQFGKLTLFSLYHVAAFLNIILSFTGRQVAVDWAVPKDKYIATQQSSSAGNALHFYLLLYYLLRIRSDKKTRFVIKRYVYTKIKIVIINAVLFA